MATRARGMSAATIANWLSNLVVALTFLDMAGLAVHALWVKCAGGKPRLPILPTPAVR
jgi:hypothetical protein